MPRTRRGVRKHVPNERCIVTRGDGSQSARWELFEYEPPAPVPPQVEAVPPPTYEIRVCPRCGRQVRYNLTTQHLNSHATPDGTPCHKLG